MYKGILILNGIVTRFWFFFVYTWLAADRDNTLSAYWIEIEKKAKNIVKIEIEMKSRVTDEAAQSTQSTQLGFTLRRSDGKFVWFYYLRKFYICT